MHRQLLCALSVPHPRSEAVGDGPTREAKKPILVSATEQTRAASRDNLTVLVINDLLKQRPDLSGIEQEGLCANG